MRIAVDAYFALAKLRPCTETWNDLGLGLLRRAQLKNADKALAKRAVVCFKRALSMCSHKSTQCSLWISIAQATLLIGSKLTALHCIKVALLINANNSVAWSLLAILLLICKKVFSFASIR
ncbi:unnamed protein product [Anisakis simplex]|uniref:Uncharacterized protein n=1 Tax=Anisakis simplex TaxID=6269 RepID=A0A3P6PR61_ANISI|nr:unnamed protein product [Anisakis simplex]